MYLVKELVLSIYLNLNWNFCEGLFMMGYYVLFFKYVVKFLDVDFWYIRNVCIGMLICFCIFGNRIFVYL